MVRTRQWPEFMAGVKWAAVMNTVTDIYTNTDKQIFLRYLTGRIFNPFLP